MGRQNKDPAVVGSSIVLLQERFKQLQRLKEMREGRQLLKPLPKSTNGYYDDLAKQGTSFSTSSGQSFKDPLELGLDLNGPHREAGRFLAVKPQQLRFDNIGPHSFLGETDAVDTSLRL